MRNGGWARASACVLCSLVACGGSPGDAFGSAPPALPNAWRNHTAQRLADLWRTRPVPGFDAPAEPALVPAADAAYVLSTSAAGAQLARALPGFATPDGLFGGIAGARTGSLFTTWRAVAALRRDRAVGALRGRWGALLQGVQALRRAGGYAVQPGERKPSLAGTLAAVQLLAVVRRAAPDGADRDRARAALSAVPASALCSALRGKASQPAYYADLASALDAAALTGDTCAVTPSRASKIRSRIGALSARRPGRNGLELLLALDAARGYTELARRGLARTGDAQHALSAALRGAARYVATRRPPAVATVARVALDAARTGGRTLRLGAAAKANLARVLRWSGALPDAAAPPDPISTAAGVASLHLLGRRAPGADAHLRARLARRPASARVLLEATLAPKQLRRADAAAVAGDEASDPGVRVLALALVTNRFPLTCAGGVRAALRDAVQQDLARYQGGFSSVASTYRLVWPALTLRAAARCLGLGTPDAGKELGAIGNQLDALRGSDGSYGARLGQRALVMETWAGLETDCLVTSRVHPLTRQALDRVAASAEPTGGVRDENGQFSVFATYALLRIRELAARGCGGTPLFKLAAS